MGKSPYRQNRKKRNLKYIRHKNIIRKFGEVKTFIKFSEEITKDGKHFIKILYAQSAIFISKIKKQYNQDIVLTEIFNGYDRGDFLTNTITLSFTFRKLKFNEEKPKLKLSYIEN